MFQFFSRNLRKVQLTIINVRYCFLTKNFRIFYCDVYCFPWTAKLRKYIHFPCKVRWKVNMCKNYEDIINQYIMVSFPIIPHFSIIPCSWFLQYHTCMASRRKCIQFLRPCNMGVWKFCNDRSGLLQCERLPNIDNKNNLNEHFKHKILLPF